MTNDCTEYLCCPKCGANLQYVELDREGNKQRFFKCVLQEHVYPVLGGITRFVDSQSYTESFGFQWDKFRKIQLDSYNETNFSEQRFIEILEWKSEDLRGKIVLDAGCGAGRFSEIVAGKYGAKLFAFDLSNAVEVCYDNLKNCRPFICQASIFELPFKEGIFDYLYCIGVIQHTPDPISAIRALCKLVKPGGKIGLWIYELNWKCFIGTSAFKYALRPITRKMPRNLQIRFCSFLVNLFYPVIVILKQLGLPGRILMRMLPVPSSYLQAVNLNPIDFKNWLHLDTLDMYSPAYDKPQRFSAVAQVLADMGFMEIRRHPHGAISITATRRT